MIDSSYATTPMNPQDYCDQRVLRPGSSFYYSVLFLPIEQREALTALRAFHQELRGIVHETRDQDVARTKLEWWRYEIERLFAGTPQHPVTRTLVAKAVDRLSKESFEEAVNGVAMDLEYDSYPSFRELSLYIQRMTATQTRLVAEWLGYQDPKTLRWAHDLGYALQLTRLLRDVGSDARRGRVYIPLDELERFDVRAEALQQTETSERVLALFRHQYERAEAYFDQALGALAATDRDAQRGLLIEAALARALLRELARDGFRVVAHRVHLTPLRKFWIAWRTARRPARLRQRESPVPG